MFNPINLYMKVALPNPNEVDRAEALRERTVVFFSLFGWLASLYSCIKWFKNDVPEISHFALVLVFGAPMIVLCVRQRWLPSIASANIAIALMALFCAGVIYQLGAINSPHILWTVGIVIFAYLLTGTKSAHFWAILSTAYLFALIMMDRNGFEFPVHILDEKQDAINQYSGFLLPMFLICYAQAYSMRLRQQSLTDVESSLKESERLSDESRKLSDKLGHILERAYASSQHLLSSSEKLTSTVQTMSTRSSDICEGVSQQADASSQINQTLASMSASVDESTTVMVSVREEMQHAERDASKGAEQMSKAIQNMQRIQESNEGISSIMEVITDIADQTNLLALNAAIEAARAGEQGRGFSVVAEEVRNLSIKSNDSTQQIRQLLEKASEDVKDGVEAVNITGEVLSKMVPTVIQSAAKINSIAESSMSQRGQIEEVVSQSQQVEDISQRNSSSVEMLISSSDSLSQMANGLSDLSQELHTLVNKL